MSSNLLNHITRNINEAYDEFAPQRADEPSRSAAEAQRPPKRTISNQMDPDPNLVAPGHNITDPDLFPTVNELVRKLQEPLPSDSGVNDCKWPLPGWVRIRLFWVMSVVTEAHFIHDPVKQRSVLRQDSKIRKHGLQAGLHRGYWEWLCGDGPHATLKDEKGGSYCWIWGSDLTSAQ